MSSTSFSAFLRALASIGSESARSTPFTALPLILLLIPTDSGGISESSCGAGNGELILSVAQETVVELLAVEVVM